MTCHSSRTTSSLTESRILSREQSGLSHVVTRVQNVLVLLLAFPLFVAVDQPFRRDNVDVVLDRFLDFARLLACDDVRSQARATIVHLQVWRDRRAHGSSDDCRSMLLQRVTLRHEVRETEREALQDTPTHIWQDLLHIRHITGFIVHPLIVRRVEVVVDTFQDGLQALEVVITVDDHVRIIARSTQPTRGSERSRLLLSDATYSLICSFSSFSFLLDSSLSTGALVTSSLSSFRFSPRWMAFW